MKAADALNTIKRFKGNNLKVKLNELKKSIIQDQQLPELSNIYESALEIKRLSAQIDEIVHATGIIQCLPKILEKGEKVIDLSLASGADGEGIDLVTNKRIAEFKFARWQEGKANGMRKRQVFTDLVNLYLDERDCRKELYVCDYAKVFHFLANSKAEWVNVLSRNKTAFNNLNAHIAKRKLSCKTVSVVFDLSKVKVKSIEELLK